MLKIAGRIIKQRKDVYSFIRLPTHCFQLLYLENTTQSISTNPITGWVTYKYVKYDPQVSVYKINKLNKGGTRRL